MHLLLYLCPNYFTDIDYEFENYHKNQQGRETRVICTYNSSTLKLYYLSKSLQQRADVCK